MTDGEVGALVAQMEQELKERLGNDSSLSWKDFHEGTHNLDGERYFIKGGTMSVEGFPDR